MASISSFRDHRERHHFLRRLAVLTQAVGFILMALSALTLLAGVGVFFVDLIRPTLGWLGVWVSGIWSLGLFLAGVQCVAIASFFKLAIQVEENTRATAQALERLRSSLDPKAEIDPRSIFLS